MMPASASTPGYPPTHYRFPDGSADDLSRCAERKVGAESDVRCVPKRQCQTAGGMIRGNWELAFSNKVFFPECRNTLAFVSIPVGWATNRLALVAFLL